MSWSPNVQRRSLSVTSNSEILKGPGAASLMGSGNYGFYYWGDVPMFFADPPLSADLKWRSKMVLLCKNSDQIRTVSAKKVKDVYQKVGVIPAHVLFALKRIRDNFSVDLNW